MTEKNKENRSVEPIVAAGESQIISELPGSESFADSQNNLIKENSSMAEVSVAETLEYSNTGRSKNLKNFFLESHNYYYNCNKYDKDEEAEAKQS